MIVYVGAARLNGIFHRPSWGTSCVQQRGCKDSFGMETHKVEIVIEDYVLLMVHYRKDLQVVKGNNIYSLSTSSMLSINTLNAISTTIFNNLISVSSSPILSINHLNATATTIFVLGICNIKYLNIKFNNNNNK